MVQIDPALMDGDRAALIEEIRSTLAGSAVAVMLYGSRARGLSRPDSDVDVLQLVPNRPRSYSRGRVNVAAYTAEHLIFLARRGSLFIKHLRDEGLILEDLHGVLARALGEYRLPVDYVALKRELAVLFGAMSVVDVEPYAAGLIRLAVYSARTALYLHAAELGRFTFDTEQVCITCEVPDLALKIRACRPQDLELLASAGLGLIRMQPPSAMPADLPSIAVWAQSQFPLAAQLLEGVLAGDAQIDYTSLTLPPG